MVGCAEPGVGAAERLDELVLRPEHQAAHGRMRSVGADDEICPQLGVVGEGDVDAVVILDQRRNPGVEAVFDGVLGGAVEHADEIAAQNLQLGDQAVAVERGHRHLGAVAAVGAHPRNAVLHQGVLAHLRHQAHALDDIAVLGEPEGE